MGSIAYWHRDHIWGTGYNDTADRPAITEHEAVDFEELIRMLPQAEVFPPVRKAEG